MKSSSASREPVLSAKQRAVVQSKTPHSSGMVSGGKPSEFQAFHVHTRPGSGRFSAAVKASAIAAGVISSGMKWITQESRCGRRGRSQVKTYVGPSDSKVTKRVWHARFRYFHESNQSGRSVIIHSLVLALALVALAPALGNE